MPPAFLLPYDLYDIFSLFGKDNTFERVVALFDTLLRTARKIRCKVSGINYRVGDTVMLGLAALPAGFTQSDLFVVKKASVNLTTEETALELIAL